MQIPFFSLAQRKWVLNFSVLWPTRAFTLQHRRLRSYYYLLIQLLNYSFINCDLLTYSSIIVKPTGLITGITYKAARSSMRVCVRACALRAMCTLIIYRNRRGIVAGNQPAIQFSACKRHVLFLRLSTSNGVDLFNCHLYLLSRVSIPKPNSLARLPAHSLLSVRKYLFSSSSIITATFLHCSQTQQSRVPRFPNDASQTSTTARR